MAGPIHTTLVLILILILTLASTAPSHAADTPDTPDTSDSTPLPLATLAGHLATKTPYWAAPHAAAPPPPPPPPPRPHTHNDTAHTCTPLQISYLSRHGARAPTAGSVAFYSVLADSLASDAGVAQITNANASAWLGSWTRPYSSASAELGDVTREGLGVLYAQGQRWTQRTPDLMPSDAVPYTPQRWVVQDTTVARTGQSAAAFMMGASARVSLQGSPLPAVPVATYSLSGDQATLLRFFAHCPAYSDDVKHSPASMAEVDAWTRRVFPRIAASVADTLGLRPDAPLRAALNDSTLGILPAVWQGCQYDVALHNDSSRWCSLLALDDILDLEFMADLSAQATMGQAAPLSYQISAPLLADMLSSLNASGTDGPASARTSAKLRFAHAETLIPLLTLLGVGTDPAPLSADMPKPARQARAFRTSVLSPFAGNVAFVLEQCTGQPTPTVALLLNEVRTPFPKCPDPCSLDDLVTAYADALALAQSFDVLCGIIGPLPIICPSSTRLADTTQIALAACMGALAMLVLVLVVVLYQVRIAKACRKCKRRREYLIVGD